MDPAHSFQIILEAGIEESEMEKYLTEKKKDPSRPIIVLNTSEMTLEQLANSSSFFGRICFAGESGDPIDKSSISQTNVKVNKILLFNELNKNSPDYPEHLEYYLFGTNSDWHLSHLLTKAPNFEQELDISISGNLSDNKDSEIFKISIPTEAERSKQPMYNIRENKFITVPLARDDYEIVTEKTDKFQISIINRFWINNSMLNPEFWGEVINPTG
jgi:hypothetical protein